jgi:hypothetical protein
LAVAEPGGAAAVAMMVNEHKLWLQVSSSERRIEKWRAARIVK